MFGLGIKMQCRKFGKWIDKKGLTQNEITKKANVRSTTVSNMCSDPEYSTRIETWTKTSRALKSLAYKWIEEISLICE
ncbi:transcriptional regulator [Metabacillus litoralis]|uniref:transcriptional regulator n=1 Tax=Metabacillus litoralis TaxID=152268 RepID=UPI001F018EC4|nr:transcriptional regulator [Metabacillus litoralis]